MPVSAFADPSRSEARFDIRLASLRQVRTDLTCDIAFQPAIGTLDLLRTANALGHCRQRVAKNDEHCSGNAMSKARQSAAK